MSHAYRMPPDVLAGANRPSWLDLEPRGGGFSLEVKPSVHRPLSLLSQRVPFCHV